MFDTPVYYSPFFLLAFYHHLSVTFFFMAVGGKYRGHVPIFHEVLEK